MQLSRQEIEHIAKLARLELSEDEIKLYGTQLTGILNFIDQLQEVNTDNIEPTAQITGLNNVFREDEVVDWDRAEVENALKQAPGVENGQVKVKRILE
jgi:aspartyl-tRNA(Asn)/glutamyl-tRNA(Gln) amidotransferase subunit C